MESMMTSADVAKVLKKSRATAYRVIKQLNEEREGKFLIVNGRIPTSYFMERIGLREGVNNDVESAEILLDRV